MTLQQFARESLDGARTRIYWMDEPNAEDVVSRVLEHPETG